MGGSEIKIIWIGDQPGLLPNPHPDTIVIKQSPEAFLNGLFMEFGCGDEDEPLLAVPPEYEKDLENLWHEDGNSIALSICVHLLHICVTCPTHRLATANGEDRWVLSGTSDTPDHRWLIPQTPIGEDIASNLKAGFPSSVESLHMTLYVKNQRSGSGASDTGSGFEKNFTLSHIECPNLQALALLIRKFEWPIAMGLLSEFFRHTCPEPYTVNKSKFQTSLLV